MDANKISGAIINAAIKVHTELGPGLLESSYEACLIYELSNAGFKVDSQVILPIIYHQLKIDAGYKIDVLVEDTVIVELKAVDGLLPVHEAQLLTYLKLSKKRLGLLLNFNVYRLKEGGIKRMLNGYGN